MDRGGKGELGCSKIRAMSAGGRRRVKGKAPAGAAFEVMGYGLGFRRHGRGFAEPFGVCGGSVEGGGGFEHFELAGEGGVFGAGEEIGGLLVGEGFEGAGGGEGLVEDVRVVDAGDDDGDGLREGELEAFHGLEGVAFEQAGVAEGFHGEDTDALLVGDGDDLFEEGTEMGVHDVDGHLHGVEVEVVLFRDIEHAEVDCGIFVAGEADVANLARVAGGDGGLHGAAGGEDAVGVFHAEDLMELDEVDHLGLETAHGLLELLVVFLLGAAVELGHEEDVFAAAIFERPSHSDFAEAVVVVPAVVHKGDAAVHGGVDELDGFVLGGFFVLGEVVAAEADGGDALAGCAEFAVNHAGLFRALDRSLFAGGGLGGGVGSASSGSDSGRGGGFEEVSAFHGAPCDAFQRVQMQIGWRPGWRRCLRFPALQKRGHVGRLEPAHAFEFAVFLGVEELAVGVEDNHRGNAPIKRNPVFLG